MIINLRDFYPNIRHDCFEDVPDEIVNLLMEHKRNDATYARKMRNKKPLSLDRNDKRELLILIELSPDLIHEKKITYEQLYRVLYMLTPKQRDRIYARYILGLSMAEIARAEGVSRPVISISIKKGLLHMRELLNL